MIQDLISAIETLKKELNQTKGKTATAARERAFLKEAIEILDIRLDTYSDREEAERQMTEREEEIDRQWSSYQEARNDRA